MHRGHIVKARIKDMGYSLKWVADKMHKTQSTLSIQLTYEELPWKYVNEIGHIINYDFRRDFPEMPLLSSEGAFIVEETQADYITMKNRDSWRGQYHLLKESYLELLQKYNTLLEETLHNKNTNAKADDKKDQKKGGRDEK